MSLKSELLYFKNLFNRKNIFFRLGYGTLLGAVREKGFIKGDSDVDLFFDSKDRDYFENLFPLFIKQGFVVDRKFKYFVCLKKEGMQFDFYFFGQRNLIDFVLDRVTCSYGIWCVYVDRFYWDESTSISFLGKRFLVFKDFERWLMHNYGSDWLIPQKKKGRAKTFWSSILCKIYMNLKPKFSLGFINAGIALYRGLVK